jgi:hypothetical protein
VKVNAVVEGARRWKACRLQEQDRELGQKELEEVRRGRDSEVGRDGRRYALPVDAVVATPKHHGLMLEVPKNRP